MGGVTPVTTAREGPTCSVTSGTKGHSAASFRHYVDQALGDSAMSKAQTRLPLPTPTPGNSQQQGRQAARL